MKKPSDTLTVTLIQADLRWEDKSANLDMFSRMIDAVSGKMELVILPEMFSTGFSMDAGAHAEPMDGPSVSWMRNIASTKRIVLAGSLIIEEEGRFLNRLIWMLPDGTLGFYDKRHLFAYAGEAENYSPGNRRFIASLKGWKVNLQVCYDLRFPVWARQNRPAAIAGTESPPQAEPEYDLLVYVANWPERRSHAWKTLLQARAIENQCYVAGANRVGTDGNGIVYSGDSMLVDPLGAVMGGPGDKEEAVTIALGRGELEETRAKLPFLRDADPFIVAQNPL